MNLVIQSTLKTLNKSKYLLDNLTDEQMTNTNIAPYHSSIGSHIRHILDFYDCILNLDSEQRIDLTARTRNRNVETCCIQATEYFNSVVFRLKTFYFDLDCMVSVTDDLGLGRVEMRYTIAAALSQANSHAIHHYAIINYILNGLGISLMDSDFGYNPTTPKQTTIR